MQHNTKFQAFSETTSPTQGPPRLAALRAELKRQGLDGFVVPRADEYQGEYVPARADRLAYLTGFTGSAGAAVALLEASRASSSSLSLTAAARSSSLSLLACAWSRALSSASRARLASSCAATCCRALCAPCAEFAGMPLK